MKVDRYNNYKYSNYLLWIILFFTFLGFYVVLLLVFNVGMSSLSQQITIPIRMIIGATCLLVCIKNINSKTPHLIWFFCFVLFYSMRILIDYNFNKYFYILYNNLFFYFISFVVIPFLGFSKINYSKIDYRKFYFVFLFSALSMSLLSIFLYGKYIGQVARLSSSSTGEETISPLILSYCGALIIGVCSFYLLYVKNKSKSIKYLSLIAIVLALVPFFLGASRGSIFAVFLPFVMMAISHLSFKSILKYILLLTIIIIFLVYLDEYLGSGLLNRFMGTSEAIERGGSSASRLDIWNKSLSQFVNFPFFGDRLNTVGVDHYPHNIYIEVLQTTGIIGGIPFFVLVYKTVKATFNIFKNHIEYAWIPVIFIQSAMKHMFSGALYTASWFWASMAIVLSINYYLKKKQE